MGIKFVFKGNDGFFVMVYCDVEDVYSGGECVDFIFVFYFLEVDGSVFVIGYDDFVVRGNGNVLNLKKKEVLLLCI